ncbi:MAG TPA: HNH endonuclease signature motif containing protein [Verrucomicrobiae bacterium]|nr:HNH endonuclease signature motif containing protein [Verrucomicrobiae bacterium]
MKDWGDPVRNAEIVRRYLLPTSLEALSVEFGVTPQRISQIVKVAGAVRAPIIPVRPNKKTERNAEVVRRYLLPTSMSVLAADFGVRRSTILKIIQNAEVHRPRIEIYRTCFAIRTKICTRCEIEKDFDAFNKSTKSWDGLKPYCRSCAGRQSAEFRVANLKMLHAREKEGRKRNAPAIKAAGAIKRLRRLERTTQTGGNFQRRHIEALLKRQRGRCANPACRASLKAKYHVDHVMPLKLGGSNSHRNIQLLCPPCNLRKGAEHPVDFAQRNGLLL